MSGRRPLTQRGSKMLKTVLASATLALLCGMASAHAMPAVDFGDDGASLIRVADGCGPFGHRNPWGECRPGGERGFGGSPPFYGPFGPYCPPGRHLGPYRHACWPNF